MLSKVTDKLIKCRCLAQEISNDIDAIEIVLKAEFNDNLEFMNFLGPTESKVLLLKIYGLWFVLSIHKPLELTIPSDTYNRITFLCEIDAYIHCVTISPDFIENVSTPTIKLVALCHLETFPLPRFPLGISCLAEAIRRSYGGLVSLCDMQLGDTISTIMNEIYKNRYDIIGISVSFGQKDILDELLNKIIGIPNYKKIIVVGGTLSALTYNDILNAFPQLIVCLGSGEETILDIIKYWRKEISINDISYIAYKEQSGHIVITNKKVGGIGILRTPALDLIDKTLKCGGAMQLETSRGCTNSCSFCPRSHKGDWQGFNSSEIKLILPHIIKSYELNIHTKKCIYLVDEEWIGYDHKTNVDRVVDLARTFKAHGIEYETSCRISQAWDINKPEIWHIDRTKLWKFFIQNNLRRVLLGIESGVDTVLARFGKGTEVKQNIYGVRLLSALNVPLRLTYITFDPLMTKDELVQSFIFQGKTDILLCPVDGITEAELVKNISDENFAIKHSLNVPLYHVIPYMLVSLECLNGSEYLTNAKQILGNGRWVVSMGKTILPYADKEIGKLSHYCQLWIDRNFSFEYTIKSIQKICSDEINKILNKIRLITKNHSYELLSRMIYLITADGTVLMPTISPSDVLYLNEANLLLTSCNYAENTFNNILIGLLNYQFEILHSEVLLCYEAHILHLDELVSKVFASALKTWEDNSGWNMINS